MVIHLYDGVRSRVRRRVRDGMLARDARASARVRSHTYEDMSYALSRYLALFRGEKSGGLISAKVGALNQQSLIDQ